ncbi:MAG: SDR family NAD(P)-dependent oxidoreductase [Microbacterium sp.]
MTPTPLSPTALFDGHFTGRTALVTGAARGIGLDIARALASSGASVVTVDLHPGVDEAASRARDEGMDVESRRLDVTDEEAVSGLFSELSERWGHLDVLVNNAGIIRINELERTSLQDFEAVMSVNTTAAFLTAREALPLLKRRGGSIINAASGQARQGFVFTPSYAASKFGIVGMSQSLAKELAPHDIRVNCYCPGIVKTDMWEYNDREWGSRLGDYAPGELIEEWIDGIPLGRAAEGADVAGLVLFLASDAARYITGQAVNIDGGMFMN